MLWCVLFEFLPIWRSSNERYGVRLQVRQAVLALQKFHSTRLEKKKRLIEDNPLISLVIGLKKIPNKTLKPHRMYLL